MPGWLAVPRDWLASLGEIARFCGRTMGLVYSGRVLQFFGEALRQAGILILGSTIGRMTSGCAAAVQSIQTLTAGSSALNHSAGCSQGAGGDR